VVFAATAITHPTWHYINYGRLHKGRAKKAGGE
jgi:hypothetical protein